MTDVNFAATEERRSTAGARNTIAGCGSSAGKGGTYLPSIYTLP